MIARTSITTGTRTRSTFSVVEVRGMRTATAASVPASLGATGWVRLMSDTAASEVNGFLQGTRHTIGDRAILLRRAVVGVALGRGVERDVGVDLARPRLHHHDAVAEVST